MLKNQVLTVVVEKEQARFKVDRGAAAILVNGREHLVSVKETIVKTI